jgi:hypothetical protein
MHRIASTGNSTNMVQEKAEETIDKISLSHCLL